MKYLFTTLAIGQDYINNAIECYTNIGTRTTCDFNITTDLKIKSTNKINFNQCSSTTYQDNGVGFSFHLNLKALALKYALDKGYDYVIYNDADWRITDNFSEDKILALFDYMEKQELDFLFERPASIGYYKTRMEECYFSEKMHEYNVFEHDKWDEAHCTNEQFMVFKVNWKYRYFVRRWEEMLWYGIMNNMRSYPDGFNIGVAALDSNMKWDFDQWRAYLKDCFEFKNKLGETYYRF